MVDRRQFIIGGSSLAFAGAGAVYMGLREMGSMEAFDASVTANRAAITQNPETLEFIRFATLAASGHNTQPWRFRVAKGQIAILPDLSRRTPIVDPDDHHLYASLGCASENLALALGVRIPTQRGHRFRCIADSIPMIADSW